MFNISATLESDEFSLQQNSIIIPFLDLLATPPGAMTISPITESSNQDAGVVAVLVGE